MQNLQTPTRNELLGPDDPPPFEVVNPDGEETILLVCDHASRQIPARLGTLGLDDEALGKHIASDLGAGDLTRRMASKTGATAVLCGYSRLVVDCNRYLEDPQSFREISDGIVVPGNLNLSVEDKRQRATWIRTPYHEAIAAHLQRLRSRGYLPGLISIHSFTPTMDGFERPWHIGVLYDRDPRFADQLFETLRQTPDLCVGDNQPYSGRHPADFTVDNHGEAVGLPCVSIEVRQDLLTNERSLERFCDILADAYRRLISMPELFSLRQAV